MGYSHSILRQLPATGQTVNYQDGDDGHRRRGGLSDAATRYVAHGNGTVTDLATGLMWMRAPDQAVIGPALPAGLGWEDQGRYEFEKYRRYEYAAPEQNHPIEWVAGYWAGDGGWHAGDVVYHCRPDGIKRVFVCLQQHENIVPDTHEPEVSPDWRDYWAPTLSEGYPSVGEFGLIRPLYLNWGEALLAIEQVNAAGGFAGHTDWRMPNLFELACMLNPTVSQGIAHDNRLWDGTLNDGQPGIGPFSKEGAYHTYWTSTSDHTGNCAWTIAPSIGEGGSVIEFVDKVNTAGLRLVRGGL